MKRRTQQSLLSEFAKIRSRAVELAQLVEGRNYFESLQHPTEEQRNHSPARWVHMAHHGSLEKVKGLFTRAGPYETFELLAIARNIFENLVWLRLMASEIDFGLVFYAHLLRGQRQNFEGFIAKITDEASLFDTAGVLDNEPAPESVSALSGTATGEERKARAAVIDDMIRREFSIYADHAAHNGYASQAHRLRKETVPEQETQLAQIAAFETALAAAMTSRLSLRLQTIATNKWNWFERAKEASMEKQYRFIYGFTSRLLHATPLNLVTDQKLAEEEQLLVLDYIVVSTMDILEIIERFSYPGMVKGVMVRHVD